MSFKRGNFDTISNALLFCRYNSSVADEPLKIKELEKIRNFEQFGHLSCNSIPLLKQVESFRRLIDFSIKFVCKLLIHTFKCNVTAQ